MRVSPRRALCVPVCSMPWAVFSVSAAFISLVPAASHGEAEYVDWHVSYEELGINSLMIGDEPQLVKLNNGWSCSIGKTSKHLPAYEARSTSCKKGDEVFDFSVQCEGNRPKDHVQIRFSNPDSGFTDFINVSCELRD